MAADGVVRIDVILDDKKVSGGVKRVEGRLSGIASTAKRGVATIGKLAGALGLVALAYKGIDMVKQSLDAAIDRYDTLNNFPRVMQQLGFDAQASNKAIKRLSDGIQGLPTRLDEVASTAQRIAVMTGDLDGAVETTLALNNAFLASGASTADAARGLEQYVQMLAKGEVDLQSWRTLQETMGVALNQLAKDFGFTGKSAQNDLYNALKKGEITFDEFNKALIEASTRTGGFAEMALTSSGGIKTALTNMRTWFVMGVADIIAAIDEAMGGVGSIEGAINGLKPIVRGVFGWIANTAIPTVAEAIKFVIGLFKEWSPSIDGIKNAFTTAFETIQSIVVPIISEVVSFIMEIWGGLVAWWQEHGGMISKAVENFMTVIFTIMQALWPVIKFIIVDTWNAIKGVIQGAIDVITGIIQFFSALFTGNWSALWDAVKQIVSGAVKLVWNLIQLWFVGKVLKAGKALFTGLRGIVTSIWNTIKSLFTNGVNTARNVVNTGFNFIRSIISSVMNAIKSVISGAWNAIRGTTSTVTSAIRNTIRNIFNSFKGIVSNAFNGVRNAVRSGITGALNIIKGMFTTFRNAGRNIIKSIADGIKGAIGMVTDAIGNVTSKIRAFLPFSPAKEGPLRDIMNVKIAESIAEAIDKGKDKAVKSMRDLAGKLADEADIDLLGDIRGITTNGVLASFLPSSAYGGVIDNRISNRSININLEYYGTGSREDAENMIDYIDRALEERASLQMFMRGER